MTNPQVLEKEKDDFTKHFFHLQSSGYNNDARVADFKLPFDQNWSCLAKAALVELNGCASK